MGFKEVRYLREERPEGVRVSHHLEWMARERHLREMLGFAYLW